MTFEEPENQLGIPVSTRVKMAFFLANMPSYQIFYLVRFREEFPGCRWIKALAV